MKKKFLIFLSFFFLTKRMMNILKKAKNELKTGVEFTDQTELTIMNDTLDLT